MDVSDDKRTISVCAGQCHTQSFFGKCIGLHKLI